MSSRSALQTKVARAFALKNYPLAIERLNDLLALAGEDPHALYLLALCHSRQADDSQAIAFATRALAAEPAHLESLKLLGSIHFLRGERDVARDYVARALRLHEATSRAAQSSRGWLATLAARLAGRPPAGSIPMDAREHREWLVWAEALMADPPESAS